MLLGIVLTIGCRETNESFPTPMLETSIISCEAAHVTIETPSSKLEESGGND